MALPKVFIASSSEGYEVAQAGRALLSEALRDRAELHPWTRQFELSAVYIDSLEKAVEEADFALFVVTPDDLTISRNKKKAAPRDKIVFELGLFMGSLGRDRCLVVNGESAAEALARPFLRIDADYRKQLLAILHERAAAKAAPEVEHADKPALSTHKATWVEVHEGIFAYVPDTGMTLDQVAASVSSSPDMPDALAELNDRKRTAPITRGQSIIIPVEFINRPRAIQEVPDALRVRNAAKQQDKAMFAAWQRHMVVRPGAGVGLIPLTAASIHEIVIGLKALLRKLEWVVGFALGLVEGFLKSIWDTIAGLAKTIYELIKSVVTGSLPSDVGDLADKITGFVKNFDWDKVKEFVGEWADGWDKKLNSPSPWVHGNTLGYLTGYVMAEAFMLLLSGGALEEIKAAAWGSDFAKMVKASRAFNEMWCGSVCIGCENHSHAPSV